MEAWNRCIKLIVFLDKPRLLSIAGEWDVLVNNQQMERQQRRILYSKTYSNA